MNINRKALKPMVIGITLSVMMWYQVYSINKQKIVQQQQNAIQVETNDEVIAAEDRMYEFMKSQEQKDYEEIKNSIVDYKSFRFIVSEMCTNKIVKNKSRATALLDFMRQNNDYLAKYMKAEDYTTIYKGISQWINGDYSSVARIHNIVLEKFDGEK